MNSPSRERAIERLLAVPAGRPSPDAIGPCADAEAVAAWLDGGLAGPAAEQFEAHVAACASCQELLAAVVRTMPVEAPVLQAVPRRPWTAWALPLAAAAVLVLAVWTTWPGSSGPSAPSQVKEDSRMARVEPPPATVPAPPVAAPPQVNPAQPAPRAAANAPPALQRAEPQTRNSATPASPAPFAAPPAESSEREAAQAASSLRQVAKAEASPAEAKAPAAAPPAALAETVAPRADGQAKATADEARARRTGELAASAGAAQGLRDAAAARVTVQAPGGRWRWRADRVLEYSSDGGATWRTATGTTAAQAADILAGTSPAPQTVWLVGRRGLVLVAIDGMRFDVRASPAPADLVAVQATDQLIAIVRAATGDAWRTTDGGRTWSAMPR